MVNQKDVTTKNYLHVLNSNIKIIFYPYTFKNGKQIGTMQANKIHHCKLGIWCRFYTCTFHNMSQCFIGFYNKCLKCLYPLYFPSNAVNARMVFKMTIFSTNVTKHVDILSSTRTHGFRDEQHRTSV